MSRCLFLYNQCYKKEIEDYRNGLVPEHRLFGFAAIEREGHTVSICPVPQLASRWVISPRGWRIYQALYSLMHIGQFDIIIATHESCALTLLLLRKLHLFLLPIVVMNVALQHPRNMRGIRRGIWRLLLPYADAVLSYTKAQRERTVRDFGVLPERSYFVPFGVDTNFFAGVRDKHLGNFFLSVGTNDGRDFATLVNALPPRARLVVVTDEVNAVIVRNTCRESSARVRILHDIPISRLRKIYHRALAQVIVLHEISFSSGQTVLLENMAMGKHVIVTRTVATEDYIEDGVDCTAVSPGDVEQLRTVLQQTLDNPELFIEMGSNAAQIVRELYRCDHHGRELNRIVVTLIATIKISNNPLNMNAW